MEISEHEFRRLVADADEQHRAAMERMAEELDDLRLDDDRDTSVSSRRRLLRGVAAGGAAVAIGAAAVPLLDLFTPALAQTSAPPPTDAELVAFAESVERALAAAYAGASTLGPASGAAIKGALTTFAGHHQQHAAALASLGTRLGASSTHKPNPGLLDVAQGQFAAAKDQAQVANVGFLLETSVTSTYMTGLSTLKDGQAQRLSASVLPVESQHSVAFGAAAGKAIADLVPTFILPDHALDPTKFPIAT
jgi:hypothetical protein